LLSNAIKFTEQGEVTLRVWAGNEPEYPDEITSPAGAGRPERAARRVVRFQVRDTGMGIKSENLPALFQPFRQIDSGLTRQHEGTGLGLAICRRLVDLMGGEISVESAWGKGSVFTFTLPLHGPKPS
jgi:signal transduction histidine kinase